MSEVELTENPFAQLEDKADPQVPTATLQVYQFINEYLARQESTHVNRASSATLCFKRRWLQKNGEAAVPLTPRKMINFLLGDLAERVMLYYITQACVGPGKLYSEVDLGTVTGSIHFQGKEIKIYKQDDLEADLDGIKVTAHVEGWGKLNTTGEWELIECKSAANWGFNDFKETGPKDYLKQAHVCMMTSKAKSLGVKRVRYFYLRKETGHLWDRVFSFDQALADEVIAEFKVTNDKVEPKAPFLLVDELNRKKPTGRKIAQFPCTYCPFLERCHGKYDVDWKADQFGFQKPVYVFKKE